jgi:hypothetical protein
MATVAATDDLEVGMARRSAGTGVEGVPGGLLIFGALSAFAGGLRGTLANGAGAPVDYLGATPFASHLAILSGYSRLQALYSGLGIAQLARVLSLLGVVGRRLPGGSTP